MPSKTMQLHWPMRGIVRRDTLRDQPNSRGPYPSPWSVNVRIDENIDRRMRGGSRPGLTKFSNTDFGTTIADIASINTSSSSGGASPILVVLADSTFYTTEGGTTTNPVAYLTDASDNIITDNDNNRITVGTGSAPSSGFLAVGQHHVFAVTTSGVTKMNPKTGQVDTLAATAGTIPTSCTFGAVYRDRLCLSGEDNAIYMSQQGDYTNWDYGKHVENAGRALPFQLSHSNEVGPLPTAIIPHKDSYLICASARTLWVVQGDPAADGSLRLVSENVGIISSRAWCKIEDTICFLSEDGIYQMGADGSGLQPISEAVVPDELRDINTSTTTVSMGYEKDRNAVHIFLRTSGGSDTHWVYEMEPQAFWTVRLQDDHSPLAVCTHTGKLLLAGGDGYVRYVGGNNDDGAAIESHVAIGPMRLAGPGHFGRLLKLHAMLAGGGGRVNWRIVTGDTAEEAADNAKLAIEAFQAGNSYSSYVKASGNWPSGSRAIMAYPRTRAVWCCLWLQSTDRWAWEGATMETVTSGRWRGTSASVVPAGLVSTSSSPSASPSSTPSASASSSPSASPSSSVSSSPSSSPSAT